MKKKIAIVSILLIVISIIAFLGISIVNGLEEKKKLSKESSLPEFEFYTLDDQEFTKSDLEQGVPLLVNYFNPTCDDCIWETAEMVKNIDLFDNEQIMMVTYGKSPELDGFVEQFQLETFPQLTVTYHKGNDFTELFGSGVTPSHFVYNAEHKLVEHYKGGAKMSLIHKKMYE